MVDEAEGADRAQSCGAEACAVPASPADHRAALPVARASPGASSWRDQTPCRLDVSIPVCLLRQGKAWQGERMTNEQMPVWEQRLRAPQIPPWTLSGASAVWPRDASTPAVVMANISGRIEAHVYTPGDAPAPLTQITDRPQGTLGAVVSPSGDAVLWFDDTAGDEVGRWVRQPLDGSAPTVLAAELPAGFMAGIAPSF